MTAYRESISPTAAAHSAADLLGRRIVAGREGLSVETRQRDDAGQAGAWLVAVEIQSPGLGSLASGYRSPAACPRRPAAAFMRPTVREALGCGRQPALGRSPVRVRQRPSGAPLLPALLLLRGARVGRLPVGLGAAARGEVV